MRGPNVKTRLVVREQVQLGSVLCGLAVSCACGSEVCAFGLGSWVEGAEVAFMRLPGLC
jgi:hypothetical protein